jgi:hypothetical protein
MIELVDAVWDAISAARKSVRVARPRSKVLGNGETYVVSMLLTLPTDVHAELVAEAEKQHRRQVEMLIRDYVRFGLKICFQDAEEEEQKAGGAGASAIDSPRA